MSVAQRGKQAHWPSAGAPAHTGSGARGVYPAHVRVPGAEQASAQRWLETRDGGRSVAWMRRLARAIWYRCSYLNPPVLYPWSASFRAAGEVHELHRANAALTHKYHGHGIQWLWFWTKAVAWPLLAAASIPPLLWRCGPGVRDLRGISLSRQARALFSGAWRHGIFPAEYYHHHVFGVPLTVDRSLYLAERELHALLLESIRGTDAGRVNDLPRFMAECRAAGLPAPRTPVVAFRGRAEFVTSFAGESLPARDLFLRPVSWTRSGFGEHWRWNARTQAWMFRGESLSADGLLKHVVEAARTEPWVMHEAVNNHPDIARFSAGGTCTARIATGLDEQGCPRVLFAALHLPASAERGWGPGPGELTAGIDVQTGRLGVAQDEFVSDGEFAVHPATGQTIEDAVVPQWSSICDLALRAHQRFGELPFVGWRIALSGGGPVLVDAGTDWGVFRHVWPAETDFAAWCLRRLAAQAGDERGRNGDAGSVRGNVPTMPAADSTLSVNKR